MDAAAAADTTCARVPTAAPSAVRWRRPSPPHETPLAQPADRPVAAAVLCGRGGVGLELLVLRRLLLVRPGAAPLLPGRQPRRPALVSPRGGDAGRVQSDDGVFPAPDRWRGDRAGAVPRRVLPRPPGAGAVDVRGPVLGNRPG